jgi:hypothetical protein
MATKQNEATSTYIAEWQERADVSAKLDGPESDAAEPLSRLYTICLALFRATLRAIKETKCLSAISARLLERNFATFALWGADFEVVSGALDKRLRRSHSLRRFTLKLLIAISNALSRRMYSSMLLQLLVNT